MPPPIKLRLEIGDDLCVCGGWKFGPADWYCADDRDVEYDGVDEVMGGTGYMGALRADMTVCGGFIDGEDDAVEGGVLSCEGVLLPCDSCVDEGCSGSLIAIGGFDEVRTGYINCAGRDVS